MKQAIGICIYSNNFFNGGESFCRKKMMPLSVGGFIAVANRAAANQDFSKLGLLKQNFKLLYLDHFFKLETKQNKILETFTYSNQSAKLKLLWSVSVILYLSLALVPAPFENCNNCGYKMPLSSPFRFCFENSAAIFEFLNFNYVARRDYL